MKDILKRLKVDRWIAEGAPVFWVPGISIVLCGAALGILSALFLMLDWRFLAVAISWVIGALTACLVACGVWFVVDALTARERPTPWRE
jgi:phosphate/sulfate permease